MRRWTWRNLSVVVLGASVVCLAGASISAQSTPPAAQVHDVLATTYYNTFSHTNAVLKRVRPGDTIRTKTLDAGGRDDKSEVRGTGGNPLTGAFYIEGAEPGDTLVVRFVKMRLNRNWGYSNNRLGLYSLTPQSIEGLYPGRYKPDAAFPGSRDGLVRWDIDLQRQTVKLKEPVSQVTPLEFPAKAMLGCIGVAPAGDFAPTSNPSGNYGGNLDYNAIGEGSVVMLPVFHPGALLFVGDGHALQGDGEATGMGVETSLDLEFTVELRKKAQLTGPRVETSEHIITIGSQPEFQSDIDRALQLATSDMARWLTTDYGMEPWAAHLLIGMSSQYEVVTVSGSMALKIQKKYLPPRR